MDKLDKAAGAELTHNYVSIAPSGDWTYDRNAMLNMFRKGAMWQSEQNQWMSFAKQMPNIGDLIVNRQIGICGGFQYQVIIFKKTYRKVVEGVKWIEWKKI